MESEARDEADPLTVSVVTWRDAYMDFDEEPARDYIVETAGWVIGWDENYIHVAAERLPDGDGYRAVTHIPRACLVPEEEV